MFSEIEHLPNNPTLQGQAELFPNIQYSKSGQFLSLLVPWAVNQACEHISPRPVIVFVQGSGWTTPNLNFEIPMLSKYAEAGYIVATVSHRSYQDGYKLPTFLKDVKCAIRFLRANAEEYHIDPERLMIYGTSSGGNTALLVGLTGNDEQFKTDEYPEQSDAVNAVAECFGPTDMTNIFDNLAGDIEAAEMLKMALGEDESTWIEQLKALSPVNLVTPENSQIPFLPLSGTVDPVVPAEHMEKMYLALKEANADVKAYYVDEAVHENNFWSPEVRRAIFDWILQKFPVD